jgi:hypothetical protein
MNTRRRVERLEDIHNPSARYEISPALELYFKHLENERRKQAGEPPIPFPPEEENWQRKTDKDLRAYLEQLSKQREE